LADNFSEIFYNIELPVHDNANVIPIQYTITRPVRFTSQFLKTNIREVQLRLDKADHVWNVDMWHYITEFPFWLEGFRGLSKLTVELGTTRSRWFRSCWFFGNMESVLRRARKKIGVQGKSFVRSGWEKTHLLVFESKNGCLVDWSQAIGKPKPNQVARWFNGYWDDAFWGDTSTRLGMLEEGFVIREMDDECGYFGFYTILGYRGIAQILLLAFSMSLLEIIEVLSFTWAVRIVIHSPCKLLESLHHE
jgi:hypothetical protein